MYTNIADAVTGMFPKEVTEQANAAAKVRMSSYLTKRHDLRGKTVLSFADSADSHSECAISLYRNGDSAWQLGVHICDVAEYVCEGSPLDIEARKRQGTIFDGKNIINMLPDTIVNEVCDLDSGSDKLALSVLLDIDAKGNLTSISFEESVIRVAAKCICSEIDHLGLAKEASSIYALREKYSPILGILMDMYELAAMFCMRRREKGGLDCTVFRKKFGRNSEGKIDALEFEAEADSRAMIREIFYFTAQSIGKYMHDNKMPCIYIGQETINNDAIEYLSKIAGCENDEKPELMAAKIADSSKGSIHYDFICETIGAELPCAKFSVEPIYNTLSACEHLVSFIRPASRYADLLTQRMLKTCIEAKSEASNINLIRYKQIVSNAAEAANKAEEFVYNARTEYYNKSTQEYLENCGEIIFDGFPLYRDESGAVTVILRCGAKAVVPSEYANTFDFKTGIPQEFEIIAIGCGDEPTVLKPKN